MQILNDVLWRYNSNLVFFNDPRNEQVYEISFHTLADMLNKTYNNRHPSTTALRCFPFDNKTLQL